MEHLVYFAAYLPRSSGDMVAPDSRLHYGSRKKQHPISFYDEYVVFLKPSYHSVYAPEEYSTGWSAEYICQVHDDAERVATLIICTLHMGQRSTELH